MSALLPVRRDQRRPVLCLVVCAIFWMMWATVMLVTLNGLASHSGQRGDDDAEATMESPDRIAAFTSLTVLDGTHNKQAQAPIISSDQRVDYRFSLKDRVSHIDVKLSCDYYYGELPIPSGFENSIAKIRISDSSPVHLIPDGSVIYVDAYYLPEFVSRILPRLRHRFVLVTGDSSVCVPDCIIGREDATALALSRLLLHWYTSHCSGIDRYAHKVSCMPLGIDQHKNARREIQSAYDAGVGLLNGLMQQPANLLKVQKDKFLLVSFQVSTNPEKRVPVWELFCGTANVSDHFASLRTVSNCFYQQDISSQTFYRGILSQHQFVVSPEGYGLDCYRTYETLLLGSYPIVKTSTLDGLFKSLPVLIVQEWSDLTVELLRDTFTDFQTRKWDFSSLYMFYWKQKFRSHL